MSKTKLIFHKLLHNIQDYEWDDNEHIVSRIYFDYEVDGAINKGLFAEIKQPAGAACDEATLEVTHPFNYGGVFDFEAFREAARQYYRDLCRAPAAPGASLQNRNLASQRIVELEQKSGLVND